MQKNTENKKTPRKVLSVFSPRPELGTKAVLSVFLCAVLSVLSFAPAVHAAYNVGQAGQFLDDTVNADTGLEDKGDITQIIITLFKSVLGATGLAFFILMIYGGYMWMTSIGNEEKVTKGKNTVIAAVIGLAIIVGGYAITVFLTGALTK